MNDWRPEDVWPAAARLAVTQPLSQPVPADDEAYLRRKGPLKLALRTWRRQLQFFASGQGRSLSTRIDPGWTRCLWLHEEMPQVGDALMDLAPRSLLDESGIAIDLYAAPHLCKLFKDDPWVRRCHSTPESIDPANYDFAIVASNARRALVTKTTALRGLPWVSLAGHYSVPDYQRSMFNARRLANLLGVRMTATEMSRHARQKLAPAAEAAVARLGDNRRVAIAVGGVRGDRTYAHWPAAVSALSAAGVRSFVLTGSANGKRAASELLAAKPAEAFIDDRVDTTDLAGTRASLMQCDAVMCADGGLMHLALTTETPVLALFTSTIDPAWRLPPDFSGESLRARGPDVSLISPEETTQAALRLLGHRPIR